MLHLFLRSLQQRDCPGFSPGSLLIRRRKVGVAGTKHIAKIEKFSEKIYFQTWIFKRGLFPHAWQASIASFPSSCPLPVIPLRLGLEIKRRKPRRPRPPRLALHLANQVIDTDQCYRGHDIADGIRQNKHPADGHGAAGIEHIGYIPESFFFGRGQ